MVIAKKGVPNADGASDGRNIPLPDMRVHTIKSKGVPLLPRTDMPRMPQQQPSNTDQNGTSLRPSGSTDLAPQPSDERWGLTPWPQWVKEFRPWQWEAAVQIVEELKAGKKLVFLDAPTGSGKTIIGEMVRRMLGVRGLYVCSGLALQSQFAGDFPYAKVLKGRSNYQTQNMPFPQYSCLDCNKEKGKESSCSWCDKVSDCAYERAKMEAYKAELAVLNTTYLLYEANHVGGFSGKPLVIADECDMLEDELMRFIELKVTGKVLDGLGLEAPKKGAHGPTIEKWLRGDLLPSVLAEQENITGRSVEEVRRKGGLGRLAGNVEQVISAYENGTELVRDYDRRDEGAFVVKPVRVNDWGEGSLWGHGERWLCMSATIISPEEQVESLGFEGEYATVTVPMQFPVAHRPIVMWPVSNMTTKTEEVEFPKLVDGLKRVFDKHPTDNILVHTVSYKLARRLMDEFRETTGRQVHGYQNSRERDPAIGRFKRDGGILFAASADRGIDLPQNLCRVVVVAKTPFASLGDRQVAERLRGVGGQQWYMVKTVRTIVQMTGRGVRSMDDWCVTYVLDRQFQEKVWRKGKGYLPGWWREGVEEGMGMVGGMRSG